MRAARQQKFCAHLRCGPEATSQTPDQAVVDDRGELRSESRQDVAMSDENQGPISDVAAAEGEPFFCSTCNTAFVLDAKLPSGKRVEDDEPDAGRRRILLSREEFAKPHVCPGKK